ncbi:hypothetical protein yc1106_05028 [Curvularia clavata]|uniref:Uncharacterized protein n=1 Tax=Curvularia clavata TaxID=95742 RepID=A0A9Q9DTG3_CURCL|nr:hypothetical protein yc1106_05028 [Curvularia clavata]
MSFDRMTPPPHQKRPRKPHLDTPQRARFFEAIDARGQATKRSVFRDFNISVATGYKLLHDRDKYGALADSRGKLRQAKQRESGSRGSGRPKKVSNAEQQIRTQQTPHQTRDSSHMSPVHVKHPSPSHLSHDSHSATPNGQARYPSSSRTCATELGPVRPGNTQPAG